MYHLSKNLILPLTVIVLFAASLACGKSQVTSPPVATTPEQVVTQPTETQALPTDAPTPSVPPLEILSHNSYTDGGWFHIIGEVKNNTDYPMEYVKIVATLYDDNNKVVGTDFTYTILDIIQPGDKAPFETGTNKWEDTTNYKLQVEGSKGSLPRQDLVIRNHESYIDGDWLHVQGEVENTGMSDAEYVKLVITLYDVSGNVVGADFTYTTLSTIPAGGTSPFDSGTNHWPNFDHYEIQVQGR